MEYISPIVHFILWTDEQLFRGPLQSPSLRRFCVEGCLDSDNPSSELPMNSTSLCPLASDRFRWFRIATSMLTWFHAPLQPRHPFSLYFMAVRPAGSKNVTVSDRDKLYAKGVQLSNAMNISKPKRRKVTIACDPCRSRKVCCDSPKTYFYDTC